MIQKVNLLWSVRFVTSNVTAVYNFDYSATILRAAGSFHLEHRYWTMWQVKRDRNCYTVHEKRRHASRARLPDFIRLPLTEGIRVRSFASGGAGGIFRLPSFPLPTFLAGLRSEKSKWAGPRKRKSVSRVTECVVRFRRRSRVHAHRATTFRSGTHYRSAYDPLSTLPLFIAFRKRR